MAEDKYSVILMRDDHTVRHFHFRPFWIRFFLYFLLCILAATLVFGYVSVKLWLKTNHLQDRNDQQKLLLHQKDVQLNRLENIEKVVAFRDPDQLEKLITGQLTDLYTTNTSSTKVNLRRFYHTVATELFSIDNFKIERVKDHSLHLRFDLKNLKDDKALRGRAEVSLLTDNARLIEHSLSENNQIFQIKHYKTFNTTLHLPDGVDSSEIFALRISISEPQGKEYFGKAYPLDDSTS